MAQSEVQVDRRDIIVIGSSAGGVTALKTLSRALSADLPATILIVQHLAATGGSVLAELLDRAGTMPAVSPADGETIRPGRLYVAPPDRHMLIKGDCIILRRGPLENRSRPAIDALFRSAALAFGPRVIGIVLTGLLDDGTEGLITIKRAGGTTIVQDPDEAEWPAMPRNALAHAEIDHCVTLAELAPLLSRLVVQPAGAAVRLPSGIEEEARIAEQELGDAETPLHALGRPSPLSCPECGGVLNEISAHGIPRYRCPVGHAFGPASLLQAQHDALESALGIAVQTHRDRLGMFRRMAAACETRAQPNAARRWHSAAAEAERLALLLEQAMAALKKPVAPVE
jgi:two-component system chemotaxis response regulator CheB